MKRIPAGILFVSILTGCETSHTGADLTPDQAGALAMQLANDKAQQLVHQRPFQMNHPAEFENGHWIWDETMGVKRLDFEARVELAPDGSTNKVDLRMLDNFEGGGVP
ncbi:MAG TPA: hypothetical protein VGN23_03140 [Verrucomicrobiae bacterium]|jgi:hypothetical protein